MRKTREHVALGVGDRDVRAQAEALRLGGGLRDDALDVGRGQGGRPRCAGARRARRERRAPRTSRRPTEESPLRIAGLAQLDGGLKRGL